MERNGMERKVTYCAVYNVEMKRHVIQSNAM